MLTPTKCDRCGAPGADWRGDDLLCDGCWDGRLQADAALAAAGEQDGVDWEKMHAQAVAEDARLTAENESLRAEIARLKRLLKPLTEEEAVQMAKDYDGVSGGWMYRDDAITAVKARRA